MIRKIVMVMLALAVALPLSACGRKGRPIPPEGSVYPRQYPKIEFPDERRVPPPEGQMEQQ